MSTSSTSSHSSVFHVNLTGSVNGGKGNGGGDAAGTGVSVPQAPPPMVPPNSGGYRPGQSGYYGRALAFPNSSPHSLKPMEGVLSKWTNVMKGWQFRWFMLDESTGLLSYFTSKEKMRRGVRRGCIRLQGAVLGIDDEEDANFTVTVDAKVFHLQAKHAEEREIWVRALEDAIIKHARFRPGAYLSHHLTAGSGSAEEQPLVRFEQRLAQADVCLQILIQQISALEGRSELAHVVSKANDFLESVKHSIVLLQIAKNTAFPVTSLSTPVVLHYSDPEIQTGIEFGSECQESSVGSPPGSAKLPQKGTDSTEGRRQPLSSSVSSPALVQSPNTPSEKTAVLFSYSSSDDEQDFYDASEDFEIDQPPTSEQPPIAQPEDENDEMPVGRNRAGPPPAPGSDTAIIDTIDYDALYDDDLEDDLGSVENHGSVLSHLLGQVKIGMDLTKVALPTFILEKRSLLEMYADFFAHPDMFIGIADAPTPKERMVAVLRWYLAAFHAGRRSEVAKKPYNPIIGEIFRCYWHVPAPTTLSGTRIPQPLAKTKENTHTSKTSTTLGKPEHNDMKLFDWVEDSDAVVFFGEQVSHHPPVSAFYAEHVGKKISLNAHIWTKSKFLGLSIGVHNIGHAILSIHFPTTREDYVLGFPNGYARSIFTVPWVELGGSVTISSAQTGYNASVEFKTKPFFSGEKNKIQAHAYSPDDKKKPFLTVEGEWNGLMTAKWADGKSERFVDVRKLDIIKKRTRPIVQQEPNESRRLWKDVTAGLKFKDIDKASEGKFLLEEKQRTEARVRQSRNETWRPRMFLPAGDTWVFTEQLEQRMKLAQKSARNIGQNSPVIGSSQKLDEQN